MWSLRDVSVEREGRSLVNHVNLTFEAGTLTAVLGPNGAGKSTLLRLMSGELEPDQGEITLDGRRLPGWGLEALARRRAVLPQLSGLEFAFSVEQVVGLGRHPHGDIDSPTGRAAVERALAAMELQPLRDAYYPRLSGGERQRTHAARALAQADLRAEPARSWLLLDEPTSALDLVHQHGLMREVRGFCAVGGGAVVILHDPNLAAAYADRLVLLASGRVVAEGMVSEVMTPGRLSEVFGVPIDVVTLPGRPHPIIVAGPSPPPQSVDPAGSD